MKYSKEEIDVMKDALKDYDFISRYINNEIKNGASMKQLLDYVENKVNCYITNYDTKSSYKYIDFSYNSINCSIVESDTIPTTLCRAIQVWDDNNYVLLFENIPIDELKKIVEENS